MHGEDILCLISKASFVIPHKIPYTYIERCVAYWDAIIQELFAISFVFFSHASKTLAQSNDWPSEETRTDECLPIPKTQEN